MILCGCDVLCEVKTDPPDASPDLKATTALTTYGRDEKYIENKLHGLGASSVILHGVGDGMIAYCCLKWRIPCLLVYGTGAGGQLHHDTIQKFLVNKVAALMKEAGPGDSWYRTNSILLCGEEPKRRKAALKPTPPPKPEKKSKRSQSGSSSTSSNKNSPSKTPKKKNKH